MTITDIIAVTGGERRPLAASIGLSNDATREIIDAVQGSLPDDANPFAAMDAYRIALGNIAYAMTLNGRDVRAAVRECLADPTQPLLVLKVLLGIEAAVFPIDPTSLTVEEIDGIGDWRDFELYEPVATLADGTEVSVLSPFIERRNLVDAVTARVEGLLRNARPRHLVVRHEDRALEMMLHGKAVDAASAAKHPRFDLYAD